MLRCCVTNACHCWADVRQHPLHNITYHTRCSGSRSWLPSWRPACQPSQVKVCGREQYISRCLTHNRNCSDVLCSKIATHATVPTLFFHLCPGNSTDRTNLLHVFQFI